MRLWLFCVAAALILPCAWPKPTTQVVTRNTTDVLNSLVDERFYDRRLRPNFAGEPVNISVSIFVNKISSISEMNMNLAVDIYLRQRWADNRLAFRGYVDELKLDNYYQMRIWSPDTFFVNEEQASSAATGPPSKRTSLLRISSSGHVTLSQRMTVTASCPMDLTRFPMDTQECSLELESYGYSSNDIVFDWRQVKGDFASQVPVAASDSMGLPSWNVLNISWNDQMQHLTTGKYSRLTTIFKIRRRFGTYLIQTYFPLSLMIIISWTSFWLEHDAVTARTIFGLAAVLTVTMTANKTYSALPIVSYITAIDVFFLGCYLITFAAIIEHAAVSWYSHEGQRHRVNWANRLQISDETAGSPHDPLLQAKHETNVRDSNENNCDPLRSRHNLSRGEESVSSKLDKCSRILFPLAFVGLNILYWLMYSW